MFALVFTHISVTVHVRVRVRMFFILHLIAIQSALTMPSANAKNEPNELEHLGQKIQKINT